MIDLHCHVLPGIDDGPRTIEASVALARAAANVGIATIIATPHVSWRYPNSADTIARLVEQVNTRIAAEGLTLEVRRGAELAMTRVAEIDQAELSRLGIGGGSWLLVEPPFTTVITGLENIVADLQGQGYRIVLAHPERCRAFHRDPRMLESLIRSGVLTSITAGALVGRFGGDVRRFALWLAREEMVHNVASDAHDLTSRPPGIAMELEQAGLTPLREWLTQLVPEAILSGGEIPPRPAVAPSLEKAPAPGRRRWGSFRRAS